MTVPKGDREYHGGSLGDEKILDDDECPLAIQLQHVTERGKILLFSAVRNFSPSLALPPFSIVFPTCFKCIILLKVVQPWNTKIIITNQVFHFNFIICY